MKKMANHTEWVVSLLSFFFLLLGFSTLSPAKWEQVFEVPQDTELYTIAFPIPGNGWVGGSHGALYRTSDEGRQWQKQVVKDIPKGYTFKDLFFLNDLTGWVVANSVQEDPLWMEGIILHTVNGNQWQKQYQIGGSELSMLSFLDAKEGFVYALEKGQLLHTLNAGETWVKTDAFPAKPYPYEKIHFFDPFQWWFMGWEGNLYWTFDAGKSWQSFPTPEHRVGSVYFVDRQTGWVAQQIRAFGFPPFASYQLYRTENGGSRWDLVLETDGFVTSMYFSNPQEGWVVGFQHETRNVMNGIVFHTLDGGLTWNQEVLPGELPHKIVSDSERLWVLTDRSVYRQTESLGVSPKGKLATTWGKIKTKE